MMVHFRKRFSAEILKEINELIVAREQRRHGDQEQNESDDRRDSNGGKLIVDASCIPQDIRHPTDLSLLNDAREATERAIDILHARREPGLPKPRTYRHNARRDYLRCAKSKKLSVKLLRKGRKKQLQYLGRNLRYINELASQVGLSVLPRDTYRKILVASEVMRQQSEMQELRTRRTSGRIVSLSQPHVRPIVRGKAGVAVEFGAKVSVSVVNGFTFVDRLSWDAYNEGGDLQGQIEAYRQRYGRYPESVHADKIYRTRDNRRYCKEHSIRISGPPLGRPRQDTEIRKAVDRQMREDERTRVAVEGKLGEVKRCYGLDRVREKLRATSETTIVPAVMVMNLKKILRDLFVRFPWLLLSALRRISSTVSTRTVSVTP